MHTLRTHGSWLVLLCSACGPRAPTGSDGAGEGTSSTTTGTTSLTGHESTGGLACPASELPSPFCHERVALPSLSDPIVLPSSPRSWRPIAFRFVSSEALHIGLFDVESMAVTASVPQPELDGVGRLFHGDFDGDGASDVAVYELRQPIPVLRSPDLAPLGTIPLEVGPAGLPMDNSPGFGFDIDRDGKDELFAGQGSFFDVWTWDGDWSKLGEIIVNPCYVQSNARGDIDGDGFPELIIQGGDCPGAEDPYDPDFDVVTVYHGAVGATTMEPRHFPIGFRGFEVTAGDYDGDGHDDVMVIRGWEQIALLHGRPDGTLAAPVLHTLGDFAYDPAALSEAFFFGALSGDFDGDGTDEVLITHPTSLDSMPHTMILIRLLEDELIPLDLQSDVNMQAVGDINIDQRFDIIGIDSVYLSSID
jgi:hypothetical protein